MYLLRENEINLLAKEAESIYLEYKNKANWFKLIGIEIHDTPEKLSKFLLRSNFKNGHYLEGDVLKLSKLIKININNMDYYNNLC